MKFRLSMKEGDWMMLVDQEKPVTWDGDGRVIGIVGVHIDLSAGQ